MATAIAQVPPRSRIVQERGLSNYSDEKNIGLSEDYEVPNMMTRTLRMTVLTAAVVAFFTAAVSAAEPTVVDPALAAAIANPARTAKFVARDGARHPAEELAFLGVSPSMTVVELWPGGGYWTEILGSYLAAHGHYYAALPTASVNAEDDKEIAQWRGLVKSEAPGIGVIKQTTLGAGHFDIAPPGSVDIVLTFRNLHNWMNGGYADQTLAACFKALKPGGLFGIEEHRGRSDRPQDPKAASGYVREDYTIALAKKAGFELVSSSEMNANPKDTKDWVDGVWTLPPTLSQGDKDRAKYVAVGEADNFVLKFRKPLATH
jgi:predicted methyltransferase